MADKPHVIVFNPDEMRWDALSHLGNPAAMTPYLDAFAETDAVSFSNAYCQNPVCVPSRCSFFTGLYPHVHGHRTMTHLLRPGENSLFRELKQAGYRVWMNDRNDLYAAQYPGWVEEHCDELFSAPRNAPGPEAENLRGEPGNPLYYSHFEGRLKLDAHGENRTLDDLAVDAAIAQIRSWKPGDPPLCIFLGLFYPHPPYQVEEPYFSAIDRTKLPPRIRWEDCRGKSRMLSLYRQYQNLEGMTEEQWDALRSVYLGMCMKIDWLFGRLCHALRAAGMYDDSAVFVLSDHGDFTGDYGMAEKAQNCFEDCLTRVPFLVKPPKGYPVDPGISGSLVELVDFYATALDFAGIESQYDHFGKSLTPILADRNTRLRRYAFCEGGRLPGETQCDEYHQPGGRTAQPDDVYWPKKMAQLDDEAHAKGTMVRGDRYKYIRRLTGEEELYDLEQDPGETRNLAKEPDVSEVLIEYRLALLDWLQGTSDMVPRDFDSRMTAGQIWARVAHLVPPGYEENVKQEIRSGMGIGAAFGYVRSLAEHSKTERG